MVQTINKQRFTQLIKSASFKELFNELGWDNLSLSVPVSLDDGKFTLSAVAEKRGFVIFVCSPDANGKIPLSSMRKKIDQRITKLYYEHLIIYTDKENFQQIWQLVLRESDKPIVVRETPYFQSQHPELLFQKLRGLLFNLADEDKITIADVRSNVREQFNTNAEKVTKKFYVEFKAQHTAFLKFIEGIEDRVNKDWYASLMLNRLMFIYFIQKKGFLDDNINYLSDKLRETKKKKGDNKFFSFYRNFLLVLFHQGLGSPVRNEKLLKEIGKVPYLNGGLFDVHQIEKDYKKIEIADNAFDKIFKFFDEYNWHLDTKVTATGKDINPDVIGYIFEKYINDRAAMGAYYTKEDITEYISKNTIIPFLFDQVKKDCANAFKDESSLWKMLQDNPDRYIYDSVKYGIYEEVIARGSKQSLLKVRELPDYISIGLDTSKPNLLERRKEWNKPAPQEYALPTEIWREVVERRNRYFDIKSKIEKGEIREINDFITYNLNIRQFAQDAVQQYEGSDFINTFYKAITKVTVLDPTCGSGAFLFAALNILEPLYYGCIERMKGFIEEDDKQNGKKYPQFRKVLEEITKHHNQQYYIYKSIILNNLYGVDIMNEAVEIAKLRLFLKLVAEVEDFDHLEPLPDIDFNIRSGNTLVGFTSYKEIKNAYEEAEASGKFMFEEETKLLKKIEDQALIVSKLFREFKEKQTIIDAQHSVIRETKDEVQKRLSKLNDLLNKYKAYEYGIDSDDLMQQKKYNDWLKSYQPFHWFSEFYEIINVNEGFNVIIGNPPYVEYSKIKNEYTLIKYRTIDCNNLWAFVIERVLYFSTKQSFLSLIVPLSLTSSNRMTSIQQEILFKGSVWTSNFESGSNPGQLFIGVKQNLSILIISKDKLNKVYSTKFNRFFSEERNKVFELINYQLIEKPTFIEYGINKIGNELQLRLMKKLFHQSPLKLQMSDNSRYRLFIHRIASYYIKCFDFIPHFKNDRDGKKKSEDYKEYFFNSESDKYAGFINSSIFYMYWQIFYDNFKAGKYSIENFPVPKTVDQKLVNEIKKYVKLLMDDMKRKSKRMKVFYKNTGNVEYDNFYPRLSKHIMDEIDKILAEHYGFTEEELDFIINYDIKYRMGKELEED